MKISLKTHDIKTTFSAKKKEIKKADDIQRKAKANFPMFSPSYLVNFYTLNRKGINEERQTRTTQIAQRIVYKINAFRELEHNDGENEFYNIYRRNEPPFIRTLDRIKKTKIGNCHEASITALAGLAANGYDGQRVSLKIEKQFVDRKTNKIIFKKQYDADHTFTITTMNQENPKPNDFIVLDPWMDFACSVSDAKNRYNAIVDFEKYKDDFNDNFSLFRVENFERTGEFINKSDCILRNKLVFKVENEYSPEEIKSLGRYARMMYPHLCL
ncbi:MAG: hypothetical protein E7Z90_05655 [Cyanobacteria bacterium SIG29]|nr:hypothetical protein [Cyanobacteria bacterium SIG29]